MDAEKLQRENKGFINICFATNQPFIKIILFQFPFCFEKYMIKRVLKRRIRILFHGVVRIIILRSSDTYYATVVVCILRWNASKVFLLFATDFVMCVRSFVIFRHIFQLQKYHNFMGASGAFRCTTRPEKWSRRIHWTIQSWLNLNTELKCLVFWKCFARNTWLFSGRGDINEFK